jgi:hypothetical protein
MPEVAILAYIFIRRVRHFAISLYRENPTTHLRSKQSKPEERQKTVTKV